MLDNPGVIGSPGKFNRENLAKIRNAEKYADMQDELLQSIINFKLCYKIRNTGDYIAPQLLTANAPGYPWEDEDWVFPYADSRPKRDIPPKKEIYISYAWDGEIEDISNRLDDKMKSVGSEYMDGFREDIDLYADIRKYLPRLTDILRDMNTLTVEIHSETGFEELVKAAAELTK